MATVLDDLKGELMATDPDFRALAEAHRRYEDRLYELAALHFPTPAEQVEETNLKKRRLAVKDRVYALLRAPERREPRPLEPARDLALRPHDISTR